jgi:hypothetical protein
MKIIHIRETMNHVNARALMDMDPDTPNESTLGDMKVLELCSMSGNLLTSVIESIGLMLLPPC